MKNDIDKLPKLNIEIDFKKFFVTIFTIFLFFLLPAYLIENNKTQNIQNFAGRVQGIDTINYGEGTFEIFGKTFYINSEQGVFLLLGILLIGIAVILAIFLWIDNQNIKKIYRIRKK